MSEAEKDGIKEEQKEGGWKKEMEGGSMGGSMEERKEGTERREVRGQEREKPGVRQRLREENMPLTNTISDYDCFRQTIYICDRLPVVNIIETLVNGR